MLTPQTPGQDILTSLSNFWKSLLPTDQQRKALSDEFSNSVDKVVKTATERLASMKQNLEQLEKDIDAANAANVAYEECDAVDSKKLFATAKALAANGADGIAVYSETVGEGDSAACVLYLANVQGRELIAIEANKFAILKAKALTADVQDLFTDSKLVILN